MRLLVWVGVYFAAIVASAIAFALVSGGASADDLSGARTFLTNLPLQLVLGGGAFVVATLSAPRPDLWLGLDRGPWRESAVGFGIGIVTQFALIPIYLPVRWVFEGDPSDDAQELVDRFSDGERVLLLLMVVVLAPVVEELFYRGALQGLMGERLDPLPAIVVTAAVFAFLHFQVLPFLGLFIVGVVAGLVRHRTGRLAPAMWMHAGFNSISIALLLA